MLNVRPMHYAKICWSKHRETLDNWNIRMLGKVRINSPCLYVTSIAATLEHVIKKLAFRGVSGILILTYFFLIVISVIESLEQRYFCVNQASKLSYKFELPPPSATLMTIPTLFALNGQADIAINLMSIIDSGLTFPEFTEYQKVSSHLNSFIIHMGKRSTKGIWIFNFLIRRTQRAQTTTISTRLHATSRDCIH